MCTKLNTKMLQNTYMNILPQPTQFTHTNLKTRFSNNGCFTIPKVKGFGMKTFAYNGCKLWNSLPPAVKDQNNLMKCKHAVKELMYTDF